MILLFTDEALPQGFHQAPLFKEGFAFLLRNGHPVLGGRDASGHIAPSKLATLSRVVLLYPDGNGTGVDDPLAEYGRPLGPGDLRTSHFLSAPLFVSGSDFVLCVPARMANLVAAAANLAVVDFPEANPFIHCVVWHDRAEMDAGLTWHGYGGAWKRLSAPWCEVGCRSSITTSVFVARLVFPTSVCW